MWKGLEWLSSRSFIEEYLVSWKAGWSWESLCQIPKGYSLGSVICCWSSRESFKMVLAMPILQAVHHVGWSTELHCTTRVQCASVKSIRVWSRSRDCAVTASKISRRGSKWFRGKRKAPKEKVVWTFSDREVTDDFKIWSWTKTGKQRVAH